MELIISQRKVVSTKDIKVVLSRSGIEEIETIILERFVFGLFNYNDYPENHWRRKRTANIMERLKKLKRRKYVGGAFPNDKSLLRQGESIMININEVGITGRRYLSI